MPCMYAVYVRMYVCRVCMPCVIVNKSLYPITDSDIVKGMNRLMRDVMEDSSNRCTLSLPDGERLIVRPVKGGYATSVLVCKVLQISNAIGHPSKFCIHFLLILSTFSEVAGKCLTLTVWLGDSVKGFGLLSRCDLFKRGSCLPGVLISRHTAGSFCFTLNSGSQH